MADETFVDLYESLQVSPNADYDTIERVYRALAKRFHPDNPDTGDNERFTELTRAYRTLCDPEGRAAYDVRYQEARTLRWRVFEDVSDTDGEGGDVRVRDGILTLLYIQRRHDSNSPGMGGVDFERLLNCPEEHLRFHMWYLKEKGWIVRLESGQWAITAEGVDTVIERRLMSKQRKMLPAAREIPEGTEGDTDEESEGGEVPQDEPVPIAGRKLDRKDKRSSPGS